MNYKNKSLFILCFNFSIQITNMSFTYVCFVTLCFGIDFIISSQVITKSANALLQNIDLVEIVKEDLRKNNEDYGEIKYDNKVTSATEGYNGITKKSTKTVRVNDILKIYRRAKIDLTDYSYDDKGKSTNDDKRKSTYDNKGKSTTKETQVIMNATTEANPVKELLRFQTIKKIVKEKIANRLPKINTVQTLMPRTVKPTTYATQNSLMKEPEIPKYVNKNKIDKFKKFMSKNKGLLKDFLSSKMVIQAEKTASKDLLRTVTHFNSAENPAKFVENAIHKIKISDDDKIDLLRPDMLDMAPAKGGRIHRQRVKGRLCQRHVLMPEGPKYDSQGKWYLPAHNLVVSRPYNVTLPPKLLLPRCCNCCKKSVLGCE